MIKCYQITISGRVQGVYYRASAKSEAEGFEVSGFVRNKTNGDVYIEAQGEDYLVDQFVEWCWQGPPMARVDKLGVEECSLRDFQGFIVNH